MPNNYVADLNDVTHPSIPT